jgi:Ser-tRNA(Ala) deacylase AlaX
MSRLEEMPEAEFFKKYLDNPATVYCIITEETIFYPQSGGQPRFVALLCPKFYPGILVCVLNGKQPNAHSFVLNSDIGTMTSISSSDAIFKVLHAKTLPSKCVIHLGTFTSSEAPSMFIAGEAVRQDIDDVTRNLNSVYHTAGHILYDAVLSLDDILQVEEGVSKAHFFPTGSYVEFNGLIENAHRAAIQAKVEELVAKQSKILSYMWNAESPEKIPLGLERMSADALEEDVRVTMIEGGYPWACCGTHVDGTGSVEGIVLSKKFRRSNGKTSIGYKVI